MLRISLWDISRKSRLSRIMKSCLPPAMKAPDWLLTQGSALCKLYLYGDKRQDSSQSIHSVATLSGSSYIMFIINLYDCQCHILIKKLTDLALWHSWPSKCLLLLYSFLHCRQNQIDHSHKLVGHWSILCQVFFEWGTERGYLKVDKSWQPGCSLGKLYVMSCTLNSP